MGQGAFIMGVYMKNYLGRKLHQLHSIMWFLGGFALGTNSAVLAVIFGVLAVAIDASISLALSKVQIQPGQTYGDVWWSRLR